MVLVRYLVKLLGFYKGTRKKDQSRGETKTGVHWGMGERQWYLTWMAKSQSVFTLVYHTWEKTDLRKRVVFQKL